MNLKPYTCKTRMSHNDFVIFIDQIILHDMVHVVPYQITTITTTSTTTTCSSCSSSSSSMTMIVLIVVHRFHKFCRHTWCKPATVHFHSRLMQKSSLNEATVSRLHAFFKALHRPDFVPKSSILILIAGVTSYSLFMDHSI